MGTRQLFKIVLFFISMDALATDPEWITINLFNDFSVETAIFTPFNTDYTLVSKDQVIGRVTPSDLLYISLNGNQFSIRSSKITFGNFEELHLVASTDSSVFKIRSVFPELSTRFYNGDLKISVDFNRILLLNQVSFTQYLSGVVETEAGSSSKSEFYMAQAILCRTYALKNLDRHIEEGFNLCDGVHCQAYKSRAFFSEIILNAVKTTDPLVAVDKDSILITAAFHANSGGQTHSSEGLWLLKVDYLQSVNDPYSLKAKQSTWEIKVPRDKWRTYLINNGVKGLAPSASLTFMQPYRKNEIKLNGTSIALAKVRQDWNLKSTFFDVIDEGGLDLIIHGRGYGHGVGLSQEGAMEMADNGFTYIEILNFYYKNISVLPFPKVKSLQIER